MRLFVSSKVNSVSFEQNGLGDGEGNRLSPFYVRKVVQPRV